MDEAVSLHADNADQTLPDGGVIPLPGDSAAQVDCPAQRNVSGKESCGWDGLQVMGIHRARVRTRVLGQSENGKIDLGYG